MEDEVFGFLLNQYYYYLISDKKPQLSLLAPAAFTYH